jgi:hypothetical protein
MCHFSTMKLNSRHNLIKKVQTTLPRAAPFDLTRLRNLGVSPQLAARYVRSGWLVRLTQGVYAFPGETLDAPSAIKFLQDHVPGLHVAGKSALALQGVRHNLGPREPWLLWGDVRFKLPDWFTSRFPGRYVGAKLFAWPDESLPGKTLTTPPGLAGDLLVAAPERALLELLYEVGTHQGLEEARNLFDGQRNLRKDLLGRLLQCCTSVKAVRLFLTWARETQLLDVDALLLQHPLAVGSDKRWMNRLKDGTLLSLKPHG